MTTAIQEYLASCWSCQQGVAARALFCHHCGSVQPPRDLDHFSRLGLPWRFDVSQSILERQCTGFIRTLEAPRIVERSEKEQDFARQQVNAFRKAYDILHDPLRRARYLLALADIRVQLAPDPADTPGRLQDRLNEAETPETVDHVARAVEAAQEETIALLSRAFDTNDLEWAAKLVGQMQRLEELATAARQRRADDTI